MRFNSRSENEHSISAAGADVRSLADDPPRADVEGDRPAVLAGNQPLEPDLPADHADGVRTGGGRVPRAQPFRVQDDRDEGGLELRAKGFEALARLDVGGKGRVPDSIGVQAGWQDRRRRSADLIEIEERR